MQEKFIIVLIFTTFQVEIHKFSIDRPLNRTHISPSTHKYIYMTFSQQSGMHSCTKEQLRDLYYCNLYFCMLLFMYMFMYAVLFS